MPITSTDRKAGIYPYYGASGIVDYVEDYIFDEAILLISEDDANLVMRSTPIAFSVSGKLWANNPAHVIRFESKADEHINGILRTLIDVDNKSITVVTLDKHQSDDAIAKDIARKLKVTNVSNISIIQVDTNGLNIQNKKIWTDSLSSR